VLFIAANGGALSIYRSEISDANPKPLVLGDRQIGALHAAGGTIAFSSQWLSEPSEAYAMAIDGTDKRQISQANAELGDVRWAKAERILHRSGDGFEVESFLLQPPGPGGPAAPTVLDIHGGPHGWHPSCRWSVSTSHWPAPDTW
jgi:dipeptidyl aminopeptidase/acylaminoacyl peptidase